MNARAASGNFDLVGILPSPTPFTPDQRRTLARRGMSTAGTVGDRTVLGAMLTSAGTSIRSQMHADAMLRKLQEVDPKLDDPAFLADLFDGSGFPPPDKPDLAWLVEFTELRLVEMSRRISFGMVHGFL